MTTTRLLRWRGVISPRNADKTLATGDATEFGIADGLIHISRRGALRDGVGGWAAECRLRLDDGFPDGWQWEVLMIPDPRLLASMAMVEGIGSEREVKAVVAEWWEQFEEHARDNLKTVFAEPPPTAALEAIEEERDRQAAELLGAAPSMLGAVAAANAPEPEPRAPGALIEALDNAYRSEVAQIAESLRRVADKIERREPREGLRDMQVEYGSHAADVLDEIKWMVGNLNLGRLVKAARDADLTIRGAR